MRVLAGQPETMEFPAAGGWRVAAASRTGGRREVNEDRWLVVPASGHRPLLLAVADGVGGEEAGERASEAALEALEAAWRGHSWAVAPDKETVQPVLLAAAEAADGAVRVLSASAPQLRGAATTLTAAVLIDGYAVLVHAGDSRAYVIHSGVAERLTADHTWVEEQVAQGHLDAQAAATHPMRNMITRCLGLEGGCAFDLTVAVLEPPASLLLCTDGVSNVLRHEEIGSPPARPPVHSGPGGVAERMIGIVANRDGSDDATVVVCSSDAAVAEDPFGLRRAERSRPVADHRRGGKALAMPRRALMVAGWSAAAVGAAGAASAGYWFGPRVIASVLAPFRTSPVPVAQSYLAAWKDASKNGWKDGSFESLYGALTAGVQQRITQEAFASRHQAIATEMTLAEMDVRLDEAGVSRPNPGEALLPFEVAYTTARFGEVRRHSQLPLRWQDGQWRVDWSPTVLLPELTSGRLVRAVAEPLVRGSILDRKQRPLASPSGGATVGAAGTPAGGAPSGARNYLNGTVAGPLIGYIGQVNAAELPELAKQGYLAGDTLGRAGVEAAAETLLVGQRGGQLTVINPTGEVTATLAAIPSRPGENVQLSLDLDLQREVEAALGSRVGSIIVIDPTDGSIRAMASFPRYDPNAFMRGDGVAALLNDPALPLLNRPAQGLYTPGSTFKVVTMAAGLESGLVQPQSEFTCTGRWTGLPGLSFACWNAAGHGRLDLVSGLTQSCNSVFYEVGKRLDEYNADYFPAFARDCGMGAVTGAIPGGESQGIVPSPAWKRQALNDGWSRGDTVNMAIGQGQLLVTPLQMASVYAAIAADGQWPGPRLLDRAVLPGGNVDRPIAAQAARRLPWKPGTLEAIRAGLRGVIGAANGTAAFVFQGSPLAAITAGKTGTAENAPGRTSHAWFACYAPVEAPRVVVLVMLEYGGEGSREAAPVARRVLEAALASAST